MAENSDIVWTKHTFNPWIGCTKVSGACDHCYAEVYDLRWHKGEHWGPKADRRLTKTWRNPVKWQREAEELTTRYSVFCASLADVFDNHRSILPEWRERLWALIRNTPNLDWLLLTKRPQNIARYLPDDWGDKGYANVWLGATAENQEEYDRRKPHLTKNPARIHFLSMEPLLGGVAMGDMDGIDWVITGGESAPLYREVPMDCYRSIRDQCAANGVAYLHKQHAGVNQADIKAKGREIDGVVHDEYPIAA